MFIRSRPSNQTQGTGRTVQPAGALRSENKRLSLWQAGEPLLEESMQQLRRRPRPGNSIAGFLFASLVGALFVNAAGCNGSSGQSAGPGPAPSTFPQPEVRRSKNGKLKTALHARIAENTLVDNFTGEQ